MYVGRKDWTLVPYFIVFLIFKIIFLGRGGGFTLNPYLMTARNANLLKHLYYCIVRIINAWEGEWYHIEDVLNARADDNVDHV